MSTFLNSISVSGLCDNYYNEVFIKNDVIERINHIRLKNEDDENMWSCLIEIFCAISDDIPYPCVDHDWQIAFTYSLWGSPKIDYNEPSQVITVILNCEDGEVTEECYRDTKDGLVAIPKGVVPDRKRYCNLPNEIKDDIQNLTFYRWNPRMAQDTISTYAEYFLKMHDSWYLKGPSAYLEEMEGVLEYISPRTFDSLDIRVNELSGKITYSVVERDTGLITDVRNMDDDFCNFFYSYALFKKYRDYESAFMGFFMTDCKAPVYIAAFTMMMVPMNLHSGIESQFFFIYWEQSKIEKMWITHYNQQDI